MFRVVLAQFLSALGFRGFLLGFRSFCWRDGDKGHFLELARLNVFVSRLGCAIVVSESHFQDFLVGLSIFVVGR